jgi:hypothetical protein
MENASSSQLFAKIIIFQHEKNNNLTTEIQNLFFLFFYSYQALKFTQMKYYSQTVSKVSLHFIFYKLLKK